MLELVSENPARVAAFLVLLRRNGAETGEVLAGMAAALLERAILVPTGDTATLDIVGTGGDGANTVNISTAAAIVAAACGARVAKHGNRSASSQCGSADVLEALGVKIELEPESVARCIAETGIGFLMAPRFHPQLASVAPLRRSLRVRTVFNVLGPLLNPARSRHQVIGVAAPQAMEPMAEAMLRLGTERTWIVHCSGLDEMAPTGPTEVIEVIAGKPWRRFRVDPQDLGMPLCTVQDLVGGDCAANAQTLKDCLQGAPGPISNAIILNAGAGLVVYGLAETLHDGCAMAAHSLMSGTAWETLEKWKSLTQKLS
jgi:anthranilate phosphoribosyltransferase